MAKINFNLKFILIGMLVQLQNAWRYLVRLSIFPHTYAFHRFGVGKIVCAGLDLWQTLVFGSAMGVAVPSWGCQWRHYLTRYITANSLPYERCNNVVLVI
jgi:hypothetical protein